MEEKLPFLGQGVRGVGAARDVRASLAHTTHGAEFNQVRLVSWQVRRRNGRGRSVSKKTRARSETAQEIKATQGKATRHSIAQCYAVPLSTILKYFSRAVIRNSFQGRK